jgi:hemerythrin
MALISWNSTMSVGVAEIDTQHQKLIGMINDLNKAMKEGRGKDLVSSTVNGLIQYTASHFKTEEDFFSRFGYPEKTSHVKEHNDFVKKVTEFQKGLESGQLALSVQVMNFLSDWLQSHILGVDKKYAPFFAFKGLK